MATKKKKIKRMAKILKTHCGIPHVSAFKMAKIIEADGASMVRYEEDLEEFCDYSWYDCCGPQFSCGNYEWRGFTGAAGDLSSSEFWSALEEAEERARRAREFQEGRRLRKPAPKPAPVGEDSHVAHYLSIAGVDKPEPKPEPVSDVEPLALHYLKIAGV